MPLLLKLLGLYNQLTNKLADLKGACEFLYKGVRDLYSEKTYVLFDRIASPYLLTRVNTGAPTSALPKWYYDPVNFTFVEWKVGSAMKEIMHNSACVHTLPILSMEVVDRGRPAHDLTDFLDKVNVYSDDQEVSPSIAHILAAWSLSSEIVLDVTRNLNVRLLTSTGSTVTTHVNSFVDPREYVADEEGVEGVD